uniref:Uncharacterized protein n=1 Tax=uncultured marine virus TaxID=186617 RepID=A0A0F7L9G7_9VIRU|nr:hypothetical protein [uncultured marine virus]
MVRYIPPIHIGRLFQILANMIDHDSQMVLQLMILQLPILVLLHMQKLHQ